MCKHQEQCRATVSGHVIELLIIIIIAEIAIFNVAGYLIEERRRWPVITASPRGQHSK